MLRATCVVVVPAPMAIVSPSATECGRRQSDPWLLVHPLLFLFLERRDVAKGFIEQRLERNRAAVGATEEAVALERSQCAPHGGRRDIELLDQIGDRYLAGPQELFQDLLGAVGLNRCVSRHFNDRSDVIYARSETESTAFEHL